MEAFDAKTKEFLLDFKKQLSATIIQNESDSFSMETNTGVKLSFFGNVFFVAQTKIVRDDAKQIWQLYDGKKSMLLMDYIIVRPVCFYFILGLSLCC